MLGSGVVNGVPQNTLAVFDRTLSNGQQLLPVTVPALPTTPAPLPATTFGRPTKIFTGSLLRTPDGQFIVGVIPPTNASTYIFVYEVASGVVLRNRTVAGASTVLSMSPDGSRFMAGHDDVRHRHARRHRAAEQRQRAVHVHRRVQHAAERRRQRLRAGRLDALQRLQHRGQHQPAAARRSPSTLLVNDPTNLAHPAGHQAAGEHRRQDGDACPTARKRGASPIPA